MNREITKKELTVKELETLKTKYKKGLVDSEPLVNLVSGAIYANRSPLVNAYQEQILKNTDYNNIMVILTCMLPQFLEKKWGEKHFTHLGSRVYHNYILNYDGHDFIVSSETKELMKPGVNINSLTDNESMQKAVLGFILKFNQELLLSGLANPPQRLEQFFKRIKNSETVSFLKEFDVDKFISENVAQQEVEDEIISPEETVIEPVEEKVRAPRRGRRR